MSKLESIYTISYNESKKLGIVKFKGDYTRWVREKRKQRRMRKEALQIAIKSELC